MNGNHECVKKLNGRGGEEESKSLLRKIKRKRGGRGGKAEDSEDSKRSRA